MLLIGGINEENRHRRYFRRIDTNGSSLAFWAAVLAQSQFRSSNAEHVNVWQYIMANSPGYLGLK